MNISYIPSEARLCSGPIEIFGEYTTYFYSLGLNEGPQHLLLTANRRGPSVSTPPKPNRSHVTPI